MDFGEGRGTYDDINEMMSHSHHERHVRDFDDLPLFDALLVLLREDLVFFPNNRKRVKLVSLGLARALERGGPLVLIILKVAVRQISVVFGGFSVVNFFLAKILRLGLRKVPEEHFGNGVVSFCEWCRVWRWTHDPRSKERFSERDCSRRVPPVGRLDQ